MPLELVPDPGRKNKVDWAKAFIQWLSLGPGNRNQEAFGRHLGVRRTTLQRRMAKDGWDAKTAAFDAAAVEKAQANALADLAVRLEDELRIIHAAVKKYAMRLGDPTYKMTGTEFAELVRTQLLIEGGGAASKLDVDVRVGITDETREKIARLPVYVRERMLMAAATGASLQEIIEAEAELDEDERLAELEGRDT